MGVCPRYAILPKELVEEGDRFVLRADLPGVGEDEVSIEPHPQARAAQAAARRCQVGEKAGVIDGGASEAA